MKDYALGPISMDFSNDHTLYLPTCHSSVKVVEFRGSNLVIVGAGTAGKGKERAIIHAHKVQKVSMLWLLSIQIILSLNGLVTYIHPQPTGAM